MAKLSEEILSLNMLELGQLLKVLKVSKQARLVAVCFGGVVPPQAFGAAGGTAPPPPL